MSPKIFLCPPPRVAGPSFSHCPCLGRAKGPGWGGGKAEQILPEPSWELFSPFPTPISAANEPQTNPSLPPPAPVCILTNGKLPMWAKRLVSRGGAPTGGLNLI